jgi:hypothetical protein
MMLPAVAATVLSNYHIGHQVLVYITMHCIHFCSAQTHYIEDTTTGLSSLVGLICAANEAVRLWCMLARLLRKCEQCTTVAVVVM